MANNKTIIAPKSSKGRLKRRLFVFFNKIQFQLNKACYKVSSCEIFQGQSCNITIPLTVCTYWREM